jgi:hypothetical protein
MVPHNMIEIVSSGVLFRNPKPHLRAVHAWHPSLVRLDNGEILASFDLGSAVESLDYATYLCRSLDGGRSWSPPGRLFADPLPRRSTHTVRISRTRDGTVHGFGCRFYRDDLEEGLTNRENLGYVEMDLIHLTSGDGGASWNGPRRIEPPIAGPAFEICHPIVELADGRLLAPTSTWRNWRGEEGEGMRAVALVSHDQGSTWTSHLEIFDGRPRRTCHWEISLVQLAGGELVAVAWEFDYQQGTTLPTPFTMSLGGESFAPPQPTGLHGQTAKIIALNDRDVLCLYRRHDQAGLWAAHARIEGTRWIPLQDTLLWQGAPSGMTGQKTTSDELAGLKFGYPTMVLLPDGNVLAAFWCAEDCVHVIRWMRLKVS